MASPRVGWNLISRVNTLNYFKCFFFNDKKKKKRERKSLLPCSKIQIIFVTDTLIFTFYASLFLDRVEGEGLSSVLMLPSYTDDQKK